jgi:O-antigen ligase
MASLSWRLVKSRSLAWVFVLFVVLLAALPFLPASMWERWATITNIESDATGSAQARRDQVVGALKFIIWHPVVGTGIGTGILGLREQGAENWSAVHNAYLQQGVELGLPGMGLYLALVIASLKSATAGQERAGSTYEDSLARQLAQATRLSLIAFAVAAIFHPVAYHFYFYYLAGLAVASRSLAKDTD